MPRIEIKQFTLLFGWENGWMDIIPLFFLSYVEKVIRKFWLDFGLGKKLSATHFLSITGKELSHW